MSYKEILTWVLQKQLVITEEELQHLRAAKAELKAKRAALRAELKSRGERPTVDKSDPTYYDVKKKDL